MGSMNVGGSKQDGDFGTPPDRNFGDFDGTPPEMPNSDNSDGQMPSFDGNPPELPNGETPSGDAAQPPANSDASDNTSSDTPQTEQQTNGSSANTEKAETSAREQNDGNALPSPDQNSKNGQDRPQMPSDSSSFASSNTETIVLLCVSAGALIAAILLTKIFKDRI